VGPLKVQASSAAPVFGNVPRPCNAEPGGVSGRPRDSAQSRPATSLPSAPELDRLTTLGEVGDDAGDDDENERQGEKPRPPSVSCEEQIDSVVRSGPRQEAARVLQYLPKGGKEGSSLDLLEHVRRPSSVSLSRQKVDPAASGRLTTPRRPQDPRVRQRPLPSLESGSLANR
jgi:hypothetical protein